MYFSICNTEDLIKKAWYLFTNIYYINIKIYGINYLNEYSFLSININ